MFRSRTDQAPNFYFYESFVIVRYQNRFIFVRRIPTENVLVHFHFYLIGLSNEPIRDWLGSLLPKPSQAIFHVPAKREWIPLTMPLRRVDTVFSRAKEDVMRGVVAYQSTKSRRNWTFVGPPGVGKTIMIYALAVETELPLFYFNLMNPELTDAGFQYWMKLLPPNAIIVFEDVRYPFRKSYPSKHTLAEAKGPSIINLAQNHSCSPPHAPAPGM